MGFALAVSFILAPAVAGAATFHFILSLISNNRDSDSEAITDQNIALLLCGVPLGYFGIAAVLRFLDYAGLKVFGMPAAVLLVGLFVLSTVYIWRVSVFPRATPDNIERSEQGAGRLIFAAAGLGYALFFALITSGASHFGWDAVAFWLRHAQKFIDVDLALLPVQAWEVLDWDRWHPAAFDNYRGDRASYAHHYPYEHHHPITIVLVASYSGFVSHIFGTPYLNLAPWLVIHLSSTFLIFFVVRLLLNSSAVAAVFSLAYVGLPLVENNALIGGYAEPWIASVVLCCVVMLLLYTRRKSQAKGFLYAAIFFACLPVLIKSAGIVYTIPFLMAASFSRYGSLSIKLLSMSFVAASSVYFLISWLGSDTLISLFDRQWLLKQFSVGDVVINEIHAFFINTSFSVLTLVFLLCLILHLWSNFLGYNSATEVEKNWVFDCIIYYAGFLYLSFFAQQLLVDYAFRFATPSSDTGNSRFSQPIMSVALISMAVYLSSVPSFKLDNRAIKKRTYFRPTGSERY